MTATAIAARMEIRPPWPDEMTRFRSFLTPRSNLTGGVLPLIAVAGELERIVAAWALQILPGARGLIQLRVRPRYQDPEFIGILLKEGEAVAKQSGILSVRVLFDGPDRDSIGIVQAGYRCIHTDTWWMIQRSEHVNARFRNAQRMLDRAIRKGMGIQVSPLTPVDLPEAAEIVKAHALLDLNSPGREVRLAGADPDFSLEHSTVVRLDGEMAAVQLVRKLGADTVFVHARAVHPKFQAHSGLLNLPLFARFIAPEYLSMQRSIFSGRPAVEPETIAMARRFGATQLDEYTLYEKAL